MQNRFIVSRVIQPDCKTCDKRYLGCHSECEAYKEYKKQLKYVNVQVYRQRVKEKLITGYEVERKGKCIKAKNPKKGIKSM